MPGEETMDSSIASIASSLISGGEPDKKPVRQQQQSAPSGDEVNDNIDDTSDDVDQGNETFEDEDIDPNDVDLLEGDDAPEGDEEQDDQDFDDVDPEELEHEVTVDGKASKVKLKDLKASYSGTKAIETRLQQAGEFRKQNEVLSQELIKQLNGEVAKLKRLDGLLAEIETAGVDLEALRVADPSRYLLEKDRLAETRNKRLMVAQAAEEAQKKQHAIMLHKQNEYAAEQADILTQKLPELKDPAKAKKLSETWNKTASYYGFNDAELGGILDHRMLLVLTDAARYRALVDAKASRNAKGQQQGGKRVATRPLLRPGTQNFGNRMKNARAEREAIARAEKSGSVDDVAATLLISEPRRALKKTGY